MFSMAATKPRTINVLVYSNTNGYRHDCIPVAIETLNELAGTENWNIHSSEDSLFFTAQNLEGFDVIVFLQTSGNILNPEQQILVEKFVTEGKGLVCIHSGTVTEYDWDWYGNAIGAYFTGHPPVQEGKLIIEDRTHPATSFFPDTVWVIEDEWYSFDRNPRENVHVLVLIDESSYNVDDNHWFKGVEQRMGDHPLVWYKYVGKGRVFQTALGHPNELYADTLFRKHLAGAINWGVGRE
jgi:type 1 glutamine amidotransferase